MQTITSCAYCSAVLLLLAVCIAALSGCAAKNFDAEIKTPEDIAALQKLETSLRVTPEKAALHPDYQISNQIAVPYVPEYRLGPGDVIEIVYHISYGKTAEEYRLEVQDKISIHFPYHPQFSSTVLLRTDGKITVPLLGDVDAESKTPVELAADLNTAYSRYIRNPSITVALEEFNVKIDELKKAITTAPRGQSKIAPVAVDGRIAFPLIGNVQAEGLTLVQLEKEVNEKYSQYVRSLKVTLIALEIRHPKVYILGEVEKPGAYELTTTATVLDAIAMAGGHNTRRARLGDVVVFRNDGLERPVAFKLDIASALKRGDSFANVRVKPADIIYVSKGRLTSANDVIEQVFTRGIYGIMPFTTVFSWGVRDLGGDSYSGDKNTTIINNP
jgi:polysaccharide biosynthesis/export protein